MTAKEKNLLEKYLPTDYATRIAEKTGFSPRYIRMVKNGERISMPVEKLLVGMAAKEQVRRKAMRAKLLTLKK